MQRDRRHTQQQVEPSLQLTVVVPTRNERDNVGPLMQRLHAALAGAATQVLFVDDSDDDTPAEIESLAERYAGTSTSVALLHRDREDRGDGLSGAVLLGFRTARAPWVAVMDSDLQHPPETVPCLLARAAEGDVDLVVGSRYVGSGDNDGLGSLARRFTSVGSGALAHVLFPRKLRDITDPMSGLFLVRRDVLDLDRFHPIGFKVLLEIAVRRGPLRVADVPYVFAERHAGESKASLREGLHFLHHLARLRLGGASGRLLAVGLIGLTGIVVNTAALWLFVGQLGTALTLGAILSTQVSTAWNSLLAIGLVYRRSSSGSLWSGFLSLAVANNVALLLRIPVLHVLVGLANLDYRIANVLTLVLAFGARFAVVDRSFYPSEEDMTAVATTSPTARKPVWLDFNYDIPGVVRIASQIPLPELEHFRVPPIPEPAGIEIRVGEVGHGMRMHTRIESSEGVTTYLEHLGGKGSGFQVEMGDPMYVTVAPLLSKSPHVVYTNIIEALLRFTAVTQGKILLHSACLEIGGIGVMLSAKTDTGKTGTILRLLREGKARFLSDDMTIVTPTGVGEAFPKPLTISQHTLRAVQADDLTPREWRRLRLQSRLHSKEGRGVGLWLAQANLPIMAMNAVTQLLVPPPKYTAGRLVPCWTANHVRVRELFIIQRSEPLTESIGLDEAVDELLDNTDDAYGFPPFADFAPTIVIKGMGLEELRAREKAILRSALSSGVRVRRLGSDSFDWADRIPGLLEDTEVAPPHPDRRAAAIVPSQRTAPAPAG